MAILLVNFGGFLLLQEERSESDTSCTPLAPRVSVQSITFNQEEARIMNKEVRKKILIGQRVGSINWRVDRRDGRLASVNTSSHSVKM